MTARANLSSSEVAALAGRTAMEAGAASYAFPYAAASSSSAAAASAPAPAPAASAAAPSAAPIAHRPWLSEAPPPGRAHPSHARTYEPDEDDDGDIELIVPVRSQAAAAAAAGFPAAPAAASFPSGRFGAPAIAAAAAAASQSRPQPAAANPPVMSDTERERWRAAFRPSAAESGFPGARPAAAHPPAAAASAPNSYVSALHRSYHKRQRQAEAMAQAPRGGPEEFLAFLNSPSSSAAATRAAAAAAAAASSSRPAAAAAAASSHSSVPASRAALLASQQRQLAAQAQQIHSQSVALEQQRAQMLQQIQLVEQRYEEAQRAATSRGAGGSSSDRSPYTSAFAGAAAAAASSSRRAPYVSSLSDDRLQAQQYQLLMLQRMQMDRLINMPHMFHPALHSPMMAVAPTPPPPPPGLTRAQIDRFPSSIVAEGECSADDECCVCLGEYAVGDSRRRLPCLHVFHTAVRTHTRPRSHARGLRDRWRCPVSPSCRLCLIFSVRDSVCRRMAGSRRDLPAVQNEPQGQMRRKTISISKRACIHSSRAAAKRNHFMSPIHMHFSFNHTFARDRLDSSSRSNERAARSSNCKICFRNERRNDVSELRRLDRRNCCNKLRTRMLNHTQDWGARLALH